MDNQYFQYNCPPKMSDGRYLTDFQSGTVRNEYYCSVFQPGNEYEYKETLKAHASEIIENTTNFLKEQNLCSISLSKKEPVNSQKFPTQGTMFKGMDSTDSEFQTIG